ncbi:MAG: MFS transporter, partial [Paludibacter sp.]|nr:MFS transporter [Paludibacter sp.]
YVFLSPYGGMLSVKYSKLKIFRLFKLLELPIMLVACISFYFEWVYLAVFSVLLMGTQSSLYSPSKYSLIRDIGGEEGVSFGSGVFEMMAFLGILIGTITASFISDYYKFWILSAFFIGLALAGYLVTLQIKATELPEEQAGNQKMDPVRFLIDSYRFARDYYLVNSAVLGAASFWLIGSMLQMNLVIHTKHIYQASNSTTGLIMAIAAIGIAAGCWAAGKISGKKVNKGLILIGITGMIASLLILTFVKPGIYLYAGLVFLTAFSGGIFQIPNLTMIQNAGLGRKLGDMIAYLNLVTFVFILAGSLLFSATTGLFDQNSYLVFGVILGICILVGLYFLRKSPEYLTEMLKTLQIK